MECSWQELETKFKSSDLGAAFTRIVRIIIALMQADICGGGFGSAAAYALLATKKTNTNTSELALMQLGGDEFARTVLNALCGMNAGNWSRPPSSDYGNVAFPGVGPSSTLAFTVFEDNNAKCVANDRLAQVARAAETVIRNLLMSIDCTDSKKADLVNQLKVMLVGLDGPSAARTCINHVHDRIKNIDTMNLITGHDALALIRHEIAVALCPQTSRELRVLTNEEFAGQVAALFVDAACELKKQYPVGDRPMPKPG
jgi:hypothetical protein